MEDGFKQPALDAFAASTVSRRGCGVFCGNAEMKFVDLLFDGKDFCREAGGLLWFRVLEFNEYAQI